MYWRLDLKISVLTIQNFSVNGTQSLILKINEPPYNGTCSVDLYQGYALYSYFYIKCINWADDDGYVARYEYFGNK